MQHILLLIFIFFPVLSGCRRSSEELPVMPPATHPLARDYIGFGVVNVSFTHLLSENGPDGVSQGYLRRGTVVRIIERVQVNNRGRIESWVLAESNYQAPAGSPGSAEIQEPSGISRGWLQETTVEIYSSESQAITASKTMSQ